MSDRSDGAIGTLAPEDGDDVVLIESLDLEARGIARREGKVIFVRNALPTERVRLKYVRRRPKFEVAEVAEWLEQASARERPRCPNFGVCGGCSMQHLGTRAQVAIKQRVLEDTLWHIGRLRSEQILRPISGQDWGYRYRARLSVRYVARKGSVLVGFHERGSSFVADMTECSILPPRVSALLPKLRGLVGGLSIRDRLPQIELAVGTQVPQSLRATHSPHTVSPAAPESAADSAVIALVLRILEAPSVADELALQAFAQTEELEIWLQPKGPETIWLFASGVTPRGESSPPVDPANRPAMQSVLGYALPEFGITMPFRPTDFTQVNHGINRVLVQRAIHLLAPRVGDHVLDLFCGLGNFTLPLATQAESVLGIEGSTALVARATENAQVNGLGHRARFATENLFNWTIERWNVLNAQRPFDLMLLDPPREGAEAVAKILAAPDVVVPRRMVYVSCNPATLARDCAILVHSGRWTLAAAGAVNMFPHTSHVESIAVLQAVPQQSSFAVQDGD